MPLHYRESIPGIFGRDVMMREDKELREDTMKKTVYFTLFSVYNICFWTYYFFNFSLKNFKNIFFGRSIDEIKRSAIIESALFIFFGDICESIREKQDRFIFAQERVNYIRNYLFSKCSGYYFSLKNNNYNEKPVLYIGFHSIGIWESMTNFMLENKTDRFCAVFPRKALNENDPLTLFP